MSAIRNILIAGGVLVGGLFAYRAVRNRFFSGEIPQDYAPPKPEVRKPGSVSADQLVTVRTGNAITKREKGMQYFPILSTRSVGGTIERTFRPTIDGYYTGRILNQSKKLYAEVQPTASSLSGLGDGSFIESLREDLAAVSGGKLTRAGRRDFMMKSRLLRRSIADSPEGIALRRRCVEDVARLNAGFDASNNNLARYAFTPDYLNNRCKIFQDNINNYIPVGD